MHEQLAAAQVLEDEVELALRLEGIHQVDDERVLHRLQDVPLGLGVGRVLKWCSRFEIAQQSLMSRLIAYRLILQGLRFYTPLPGTAKLNNDIFLSGPEREVLCQVKKFPNKLGNGEMGQSKMFLFHGNSTTITANFILISF